MTKQGVRNLNNLGPKKPKAEVTAGQESAPPPAPDAGVDPGTPAPPQAADKAPAAAETP
ncbi:MAG: hypothetical protein ABUR63_03310 [Verrucomicrobiota bacterium]